MKSVDALRRKLRGLLAVTHDSAATDHERANAEALKVRIEGQLRAEGAPKGDWTDTAFRLGRTLRKLDQSTAPPASVSGSAKIPYRLGKALGQGLKKWRSTS